MEQVDDEQEEQVQEEQMQEEQVQEQVTEHEKSSPELVDVEWEAVVEWTHESMRNRWWIKRSENFLL